jgi:hypothetical protein
MSAGVRRICGPRPRRSHPWRSTRPAPEIGTIEASPKESSSRGPSRSRKQSPREMRTFRALRALGLGRAMRMDHPRLLGWARDRKDVELDRPADVPNRVMSRPGRPPETAALARDAESRELEPGLYDIVPSRLAPVAACGSSREADLQIGASPGIFVLRGARGPIPDSRRAGSRRSDLHRP